MIRISVGIHDRENMKGIDSAHGRINIISMNKFVCFLTVFFSVCYSVLAQNENTNEVGSNVPTNDFLNLRRECVYTLSRDFKCSDDSVIPFLLYEYFKERSSGHMWQGCLMAIPKNKPRDIKLKYDERFIEDDLLISFYDILFDREKLLMNYDLYVFYVPESQLTNLNDSGDTLTVISDIGEEIVYWMEKDDAVASVYHYEKGKWKYYDTVATEGSSRFKATDIAEELLEKRFECK